MMRCTIVTHEIITDDYVLNHVNAFNLDSENFLCKEHRSLEANLPILRLNNKHGSVLRHDGVEAYQNLMFCINL